MGRISLTVNGDDSNQGSSPSSPQEKGNRNNREILSEISTGAPTGGSSSSLTEFPRYEESLEEKFMAALSHLESWAVTPDQSKEKEAVTTDQPKEKEAIRPDQAKDEEAEESGVSEWDNPIVSQLEELLKNNLYEIFQSAVKKISECGYNEEVAEWVILRNGPYYGIKDAVSNIVDGALGFLRREKEYDMSRTMFKDLEQLVEYAILEIVSVLSEVKPFLSVADAMWCLLISDLNLAHACAVEDDPSSSLLGGEDAQGESSSDTSSLTQNETEAQHIETTVSNPKQPNISKPLYPNPQNSRILNTPLVHETQIIESETRISLQVTGGRSLGNSGDHIQGGTQATDVEDNHGIGKKGNLANSRRDMLRQKTFHFEKNYRGRMSKGAFKAKLSSWGGLVLDKKLKSRSDSSDVNLKNSALPSKETVSALPAVKTQPPKSLPQEKAKPILKPQISTPAPAKTAEHYLAGIPYDESLGKYVPQDEKDEVILAAVSQMNALKKELQNWNDWANEKVMQATRRLSKDQPELKVLRQEKEEAERFRKEKQTLEESTMKRLSDVEHALTSNTGQIEMANATVRRLEVENSGLKKDMEASNQKGFREAAKVEEAILREEEALKKVQACGPQKDLLQDELTALKGKSAAMQKEVQNSKDRLNQTEAQKTHEEREKIKLFGHANAIKRERIRLEALAREEEERLNRKAEGDLQKLNDAIKKMEKQISELKLDSESSKIAALRTGINRQPPKMTQRLAVFQDNFGGAGGVKEEHECAMCLSEAKTVVFLPCSHQVLCANCNVIHEKKGMEECPSCRAKIQRRIIARFAIS